jgi:hypothetical protein
MLSFLWDQIGSSRRPFLFPSVKNNPENSFDSFILATFSHFFIFALFVLWRPQQVGISSDMYGGDNHYTGSPLSLSLANYPQHARKWRIFSRPPEPPSSGGSIRGPSVRVPYSGVPKWFLVLIR